MRKYVELFKFWLRMRRANKSLLKSVNEHKNDPMYPPPTRQELLTFINEGKIGEFSFGPQYFRHNLTPIKPAPFYKFPKE